MWRRPVQIVLIALTVLKQGAISPHTKSVKPLDLSALKRSKISSKNVKKSSEVGFQPDIILSQSIWWCKHVIPKI